MDMTPVLLGKLATKYRNIKVIRNSERLGKSASVNLAIEEVKAPLTAIIDADTSLEKSYI
jgi:GT2 family glycosyltransferase